MSLYISFFNSCIINAVLDVSSHVLSVSCRLFVTCICFQFSFTLRRLCQYINNKELNCCYYYYYYYVQNAYEHIVVEVERKT